MTEFLCFVQLVREVTLLELKQYKEAMEYFDKALAIDPNNVSALKNKELTQLS